MTVRYRIVLSALLALCLSIAACMSDNEADDEQSHRTARGIGTSPSANSIQDAGPDAQVK